MNNKDLIFSDDSDDDDDITKFLSSNKKKMKKENDTFIKQAKENMLQWKKSNDLNNFFKNSINLEEELANLEVDQDIVYEHSNSQQEILRNITVSEHVEVDPWRKGIVVFDGNPQNRELQFPRSDISFNNIEEYCRFISRKAELMSIDNVCMDGKIFDWCFKRIAIHYQNNSTLKNTLYNAINNHKWKPSYTMIFFVFKSMGLRDIVKVNEKPTATTTATTNSANASATKNNKRNTTPVKREGSTVSLAKQAKYSPNTSAASETELRGVHSSGADDDDDDDNSCGVASTGKSNRNPEIRKTKLGDKSRHRVARITRRSTRAKRGTTEEQSRPSTSGTTSRRRSSTKLQQDGDDGTNAHPRRKRSNVKKEAVTGVTVRAAVEEEEEQDRDLDNEVLSYPDKPCADVRTMDPQHGSVCDRDNFNRSLMDVLDVVKFVIPQSSDMKPRQLSNLFSILVAIAVSESSPEEYFTTSISSCLSKITILLNKKADEGTFAQEVHHITDVVRGLQMDWQTAAYAVEHVLPSNSPATQLIMTSVASLYVGQVLRLTPAQYRFLSLGTICPYLSPLLARIKDPGCDALDTMYALDLIEHSIQRMKFSAEDKSDMKCFAQNMGNCMLALCENDDLYKIKLKNKLNCLYSKWWMIANKM